MIENLKSTAREDFGVVQLKFLIFFLIVVTLSSATFSLGDHLSVQSERSVNSKTTPPVRKTFSGEENTPHTATSAQWPRTFFQNFSRSQDGETEDAHFQIRFTAVPFQTAPGAPRCIQVKLSLAAEYASKRTYYRRRLDSLRLFNDGKIATGGASTSTQFITDEIRRNGRRIETPPISKPPSFKSFFEIGSPQKTHPIYISNGTENGEGEIGVACVREHGNYSGSVELKAAENAPEKITIPWSFRFDSNGISTISFRLNEMAVPDPEEFMGDLHPRQKLRAGERLENVNYRLVNSSRYPSNAPDGYYQSRFPNPNSQRETY